MSEQIEATAFEAATVDRRAYGVVLRSDWADLIEIHEHPTDGSPVVSAPHPASVDGERPILLLHGVGNDGLTFAPILPSLAERRPVLAPRLSPDLLTVSDDRAEAVEQLVEFLTALTPPPWRIVGHSMGGVLTGLLIRARPELVEGVVLLNSPLPGVSWRFREGDTLDRTGRAVLTLKLLAQVTAVGRPRLPGPLRGIEVGIVRRAMRGFVVRPDAIDDEVIRRAIIDARTRDGDQFLRLARKLPEWELSPVTDVPVHVIAGADDPLLSPGDLDRVALAYPDAWFQVLDDVAHFAHLEQPGVTVATIDAAFAGRARVGLPRWRRRRVG